MPIAQIVMMEGRDVDKKRRLIAAVTDAIEKSLEAPRHSIRVILVEVPKEHFGIGGVPAADLSSAP